MNASNLMDDHGTPVRWKAATLISTVALVLTLVLSIAKAGAKSEKLDSVARKVENLEGMAGQVQRLDAWKEDVNRRLSTIEADLKELLKRRER